MIKKAQASAPIIKSVTITNTLSTLSNAVLYLYDAINMYENNEYVEFKSDRSIDPSIDTMNNRSKNSYV